MKANIKSFFPGANTYRGFHSYFTYLPYKMKRVYIIKGGPGTGKSTFMKKISEDIVQMGFDLEKHFCASDHESLDGLAIPALKTAILDGTVPHTVDPRYPGAVEEIINLGQFWNSAYLINKKNDIIRINKKIKKYFNKTYHYLKLAWIFNNEIEDLHQQGFNFKIADDKARAIIKEIPETDKTESPPKRHLFASGITPGGLINFYDSLTNNCKKRYLITGKPGTGKSTLIKKIAAAAARHGYETLHLHCSLDPESLDSVIIKELKTAVINNTPPHTVKQDSSKDISINMMECINGQEIQQNEITEHKKNYKKYIDKALEQLNKEKKAHDKLEEYYVEAMNFNRVERYRKRILQKIMNYKIR